MNSAADVKVLSGKDPEREGRTLSESPCNNESETSFKRKDQFFSSDQKSDMTKLSAHELSVWPISTVSPTRHSPILQQFENLKFKSKSETLGSHSIPQTLTMPSLNPLHIPAVNNRKNSYSSPLLDYDYLSSVLERCSETTSKELHGLPTDSSRVGEQDGVTSFLKSPSNSNLEADSEPTPIATTAKLDFRDRSFDDLQERAKSSTLRMQQKAHLLTTVYYSLVRRPQFDSLMAARQEIFDILHLEDWDYGESNTPELLSAKVAIIDVSKCILELWNLFSAQEDKRQLVYSSARNQIKNSGGSHYLSSAQPYQRCAIPTPPRSVAKDSKCSTEPCTPKRFSDNNSILLPRISSFLDGPTHDGRPLIRLSNPQGLAKQSIRFPQASEATPVKGASSYSRHSMSTTSSSGSNDFPEAFSNRKSGRSPSKRTRCNFTPYARSLLLEVFANNPRPDINIKRQIVARTGLSLVQVSDWFVNERRRSNHQDEKRKRKYLEPKVGKKVF